MLLGRVIGTVVACERYTGLEGVPFLWVQPLDRQGQEVGLSYSFVAPGGFRRRG